MQRAERRQAEREGRRVRTLGELDYLLGVADETRRWRGDDEFQVPVPADVPALIELGRLLQIAERILRRKLMRISSTVVLTPGRGRFTAAYTPRRS
jgi:serine/threonine-protein kinase HipA